MEDVLPSAVCRQICGYGRDFDNLVGLEWRLEPLNAFARPLSRDRFRPLSSLSVMTKAGDFWSSASDTTEFHDNLTEYMKLWLVNNIGSHDRASDWGYTGYLIDQVATFVMQLMQNRSEHEVEEGDDEDDDDDGDY